MYARYELNDEQGETRRQRNERFGQGELSPELVVPEQGQYLWNWFFELDEGRSGGSQPLTALEISAWADLTGNIMTRQDFRILRSMDRAYLHQYEEELKDARAWASD